MYCCVVHVIAVSIPTGIAYWPRGSPIQSLLVHTCTGIIIISKATIAYMCRDVAVDTRELFQAKETSITTSKAVVTIFIVPVL